MKVCKDCSDIYRKPGVTISKCGKKFETKIEVDKHETIKDEFKKPVSRYSRTIKPEITQEENTDE